MVKRFALTVMLICAFLGFGAAAASAQVYPPQQASVTASAHTVGPGATVTFVATGFRVGSTVTFTIFSTPRVLGTAVADANGTATLTVQLPSDLPPGDHVVKASGIDPQGNPLTVSTPITIVGNGATTTPRTGSRFTVPLTRIGVSAVALGGLLVLVARRRRENSAAH